MRALIAYGTIDGQTGNTARAVASQITDSIRDVEFSGASNVAAARHRAARVPGQAVGTGTGMAAA